MSEALKSLAMWCDMSDLLVICLYMYLREEIASESSMRCKA